MKSIESSPIGTPSRHGGPRPNSGRPKGYSPKSAAAIEATIKKGVEEGNDDEADLEDPTRTAVVFAIARARKESALADLNELQYKIKSGLYVEREEVRQATTTMLAELAQGLRSLPDALERKFNLKPDQAEEVEKVIDEALSGIANGLERLCTEVEIE